MLIRLSIFCIEEYNLFSFVPAPRFCRLLRFPQGGLGVSETVGYAWVATVHILIVVRGAGNFSKCKFS